MARVVIMEPKMEVTARGPEAVLCVIQRRSKPLRRWRMPRMCVNGCRRRRQATSRGCRHCSASTSGYYLIVRKIRPRSSLAIPHCTGQQPTARCYVPHIIAGTFRRLGTASSSTCGHEGRKLLLHVQAYLSYLDCALILWLCGLLNKPAPRSLIDGGGELAPISARL